MSYRLTTNAPPDRLPWIEKYRAKYLDDIVGHDEDIATIRNLIDKKALPHFLFYGPPGTGKTSLILAVARELYGENYRSYIREINASSERGIDTIRGNVTKFIKTRSNMIKLTILDEFDAMTEDAQGALRGVIESSSGNNRFCLICNNVNKVIKAIRSRCVPIKFSSLRGEAVKSKVKYIIEQENIDITDEAVDSLIELESDFRQLLNILQGIHFLHNALETQIDKDAVYKYLHKPKQEEIQEVVDILIHGEFDKAYQTLKDLIASNRWSLIDMLQYLLDILLTMDLGIERKNFLISELSDIEYRVKKSCESNIQLAHLVSTFISSRKLKG